MSNKELIAIGDDGCHDVIKKILDTKESCKILDVPCGHGVLTQFLHERNWEVVTADIDAGNMLFDKVPFHEVNLNRALPFENESFDAILCANGLHRLFNPGGAIKEFARILKPGGALYINSNNYASLDKRIRFLLMGSVNSMINRGVCSQTIENAEAHVRIPLLFVQIAGMLEENNFSIVDVRPCIVRLRERILLPLAWLIRGLSLLIPKKTREENRVKESNAHALMPGGSYMFIEAVKKS
jgi:SAM-dependent methyltransferase